MGMTSPLPDRRGETVLRPSASLLDVVMLGAGSAIGSSIFSVLGPAARIAGNSLIWAVAVAALPMVVLGVVYAFVAGIVPRSGASYAWPREFIGPRFSFAVAWLRILGSAGMLVTGGLVLAEYIAVVTPVPPVPIMLGVFVVTFALNLFGVSFAAKAQTVMMAILLTTFVIFVVAAMPSLSAARLAPLVHGWNGLAVLATLPLLINLFMGIETATEIGEEVRNARRNVPLGIGLSVLLSLVVYIVVVGVALGVLGLDGLAAANTPLADAARSTGSRIALAAMLGGAILCLVKSINANFMIFARNLFAMGRSGVLPFALARVHPRWGTPWVAACVVFALTCLGLLLPQDLAYLLIATSLPTLLKYLSTCLCALVILRRRPELVALSPFGARAGLMLPLVVLGAVSAIVIALAGLETDWRPYVLMLGWGVVGIIYWVVRGEIDPVVQPDITE